ncbi:MULTISPECIES: Thoeris anti-defense Tad2 family protein [Cloacibacillus]|uniref:Thoeris anti-defense Tad2 family protein n=1 Tax=Cloacibacillus TaxID=508459 RepID=UPI000451283D|nr:MULTISPECIES: hypothetical protein [Cloacibacillus]EXG78355.1 hypothetical protein Cloev_0473 [Cloacibacillus evryensis DSM 19522]MEA5034836.1 hypothetical protein [Cloacibacillus evryensis]
MCKYVKRPVVVEAVKFEDSTECFDKLQALGLDPVRVNYADKDNPVIKIDTLEGEMTGQVGDYVIRGVNGEFYPCKPDIFEKTYAKEGSYPTKHLSFGAAFDYLKIGNVDYMRLPQWKEDVKIRIQRPDENSKMRAPYLYVESRFGRVPWKETMIELFSDEWEVGFDE